MSSVVSVSVSALDRHDVEAEDDDHDT